MYWIYKFGVTRIPQWDPSHFVGTGTVKNFKLLPLAGGGVYDSLGTEQARLQGVEIQVQAAISLLRQTKAQLEAQERALRGLVGKFDRLYRKWDESGIREWCWARCTAVGQTRSVPKFPTMDIPMVFEMESPCWYGFHHGPGWFLDSGIHFDDGWHIFDESEDVLYALSSSPLTITIDNDGNYPVRNPTITITAVGSAITELTIKKTGQTDLKYTGTIAVGKSLVLDCGAFTVLNDGTDDFIHFSREANHLLSEWICLDSGSNTFEITHVGGSGDSTIVFTFFDGWA